MKHLILLVFISLTTFVSKAQQNDLTLEECYSQAQQNYPLVKQRELLAQSKEYSIENVSKGNLPQVIISGQASYQSDVTQLPIKIPGMGYQPPLIGHKKLLNFDAYSMPEIGGYIIIAVVSIAGIIWFVEKRKPRNEKSFARV